MATFKKTSHGCAAPIDKQSGSPRVHCGRVGGRVVGVRLSVAMRNGSSSSIDNLTPALGSRIPSLGANCRSRLLAKKANSGNLTPAIYEGGVVKL
jgi:hypothetical protein